MTESGVGKDQPPGRVAGGTGDPADCPLEHWRNTAQEDGIRVRDRLREGVTNALRVLGSGFLAHPANGELRRRIESGELSTQIYFEQLLRLVYRLIFLATIEDRELVFAPAATAEARARYLAGYSLARLRRLATRRRSYDRHADLWQALSITFAGLAGGQPALGLPALGGLFDAAQCPDLDTAQLDNQSLLSALFGLCFFRDGAALSRVNYRDMDSEELGSVYESLLELVPNLTLTASVRQFAFIGDEEAGSTKGNARKLSGSYYTPDSLVQELIRSALDPVIAQTLAAHPRQPVQALLELSVCDPACGSGHFLLAAARRIAEEVARLSATDGNPLPADYRHALRDVVAHCIYGVDKNPLAVELARTALWLEAYTPDRPLTFLDHHLRCGDALLGILDPAILEAGIPDKAFNMLSGDDKTVVTALKKANRDALKAIEKAKTRAAFNLALGFYAAPEAAALDALPDDTLAALEAKRAAFVEAEARSAASRARLAADLFVAAFVLPKTRDTEKTVPTTQDLWLVLNGSAPRPGVAVAAARAAQTAQAFHWWQAFPQVRAKGGFAVLVGNPPWERIKLQEEEFFASRSPLIVEAPHKAERGRRIELLREGMLLHSLYPEVEAAQGLAPPNVAEQALHAEFLVARRIAEAASLFAHDSGRYPLTGVGDVNTYALFAETFVQLVEETGRAGFIVPTGIGTDDSTKLYFEEVSQNQRLVALYSFENEEFIFPAVHHAMKFCLMIVAGQEARIRDSSFVHFARQTSYLYDLRRRFVLAPEEFRLINPNTLTCPVFRSERDADLTKKLYRAAPVLIAEGPPECNSWGVQIRRVFDMAKAEVVSSCSREPRTGYLPMYEAKMMHQFDHRWATYAADGSSSDVAVDTKIDPNFSVVPRYWVEATEVASRLTAKGWSHGWLMGWRDITNATNERTVIASVVPRVGSDFTLRVPPCELQFIGPRFCGTSKARRHSLGRLHCQTASSNSSGSLHHSRPRLHRPARPRTDLHRPRPPALGRRPRPHRPALRLGPGTTRPPARRTGRDLRPPLRPDSRRTALPPRPRRHHGCRLPLRNLPRPQEQRNPPVRRIPHPPPGAGSLGRAGWGGAMSRELETLILDAFTGLGRRRSLASGNFRLVAGGHQTCAVYFCGNAPGGSRTCWQARRPDSLRTRYRGCRRRPKPSGWSSSASVSTSLM